MGAIFEQVVYSFGIKFALLFLIAPLGILLSGYLVFILVESIKELKRNNIRDRRNKREENEETKL